ncbi:MAG: 2-oxo-4-hydroxy-4-carboxy-5-ureidoimidazoline decarboxylase [Candidatus Eisenbacteria bacterium]|uniref:2-oxo-4-hydroxy-4-carboxy-5-ureidoimidazoline decarboxylase n=1 Tax=Eiseniibacteriota bacterium TaxID=2212470 RepID=A0A933SG20_UNCEI|nr:2-oxo-4-hydroxy-4-carboxy-5-ureidoimidazoline decarboxylase [Candidatus Eisenbacteria bacterium]
MTIEQLNAAPAAAAAEALERCCGASAWVRAMLGARPFASAEALHAAADACCAALEERDWLEAFTHHPRIGDVASLRAKFASTARWAGGEQAGAAAADEATLQALAKGNDDYFARFGFIFIVCASGLSAAEMLARLEARLPHERAEELRIAASEQNRITHLRLDKLLREDA